MKPRKKNLEFSDIAHSYWHVLFGLVGQLYLVLFSTLYWALEYEFETHLGISQQQLLAYFSLFSLLVLVLSRHTEWSFPVVIEDALIVAFFWMLVSSLVTGDCACCAAPTADCFWQQNQVLYSMLCVVLMLCSFIFDARLFPLSLLFKALAVALLLFVPLVPISCNQFNLSQISVVILKFSLFVLAWFVQRRQRLTEAQLSTEYLKAMAILRSYEHYKRLFASASSGDAATEKKRAAARLDEDTVEWRSEEMHVPVYMFARLERLDQAVAQYTRQQRKAGAREDRAVAFDMQTRKLCELCRAHRDQRAFTRFFSWKNRHYDTRLLFILDLAGTVWILTVCDWFLFFTALQLLLVYWRIACNMRELRLVSKLVKFMDYVYENGAPRAT
jgi:hypothetical protein